MYFLNYEIVCEFAIKEVYIMLIYLQGFLYIKIKNK